jgi:hypothetical protein
MWQRWYKHQCVAVGWYSKWGFLLKGPTDDHGWSRTRKSLEAIGRGDMIVVSLRGNRVGRIGEVTGKAVADTDWNTLVPPSRDEPDGEMGRQIFVRWDMSIGPDSRDMVVALPPEAQLTSGELRPTIAQVRSRSAKELIEAMNDSSNWVGLLTHFDYEKALSGYIAAYPHRLEDGLLPHPNERVRERVFGDSSRLDVLLTDRNGVPVIVECKQGNPSSDHLKQIRHYMVRLQTETGIAPRGILVHGGARKLRPEVATLARDKPEIEIVQYTLDVDFTRCQ